MCVTMCVTEYVCVGVCVTEYVCVGMCVCMRVHVCVRVCLHVCDLMYFLCVFSVYNTWTCACL